MVAIFQEIQLDFDVSECSLDLYLIICSKTSHSCNVFYTCFITAKIIHTHKIAVDISKKLGGVSLHSFSLLNSYKSTYTKVRHSNYCEHVSKVLAFHGNSYGFDEIKMKKI